MWCGADESSHTTPAPKSGAGRTVVSTGANWAAAGAARATASRNTVIAYFVPACRCGVMGMICLLRKMFATDDREPRLITARFRTPHAESHDVIMTYPTHRFDAPGCPRASAACPASMCSQPTPRRFWLRGTIPPHSPHRLFLLHAGAGALSGDAAGACGLRQGSCPGRRAIAPGRPFHPAPEAHSPPE